MIIIAGLLGGSEKALSHIHTEMMVTSGIIVDCFVGERFPLIFSATTRGGSERVRGTIGSGRSGSEALISKRLLSHYITLEYMISNILCLVYGRIEALIYT